MTRVEVLYRPEALSDLEDIYRWVFEASLSPATADAFAERIVVACEKLGGMPHGGRNRDDLLPGLRTFPFERRAVIAYFVDDKAVHIANIFYGGQNFEDFYGRSSDAP